MPIGGISSPSNRGRAHSCRGRVFGRERLGQLLNAEMPQHVRDLLLDTDEPGVDRCHRRGERRRLAKGEATRRVCASVSRRGQLMWGVKGWGAAEHRPGLVEIQLSGVLRHPVPGNLLPAADPH